jgi:hypothetical protein
MSIVVGSHRVGFSNVAQQQYNANTHPRWEWSPGPRTPAFATTHTQKQTPNKTVRSTGLSSHHCRPPVGVAPRAANSSIRHNTQASKKKPNKTVRPTGLSSHHCRPPVGVAPRAANSSIRHNTNPKANANQNSSPNRVEPPAKRLKLFELLHKNQQQTPKREATPFTLTNTKYSRRVVPCQIFFIQSACEEAENR